MKINRYKITKRPNNVKYTLKDPETGNVKITGEVYDKFHDEIMEIYLHQTSDKK